VLLGGSAHQKRAAQVHVHNRVPVGATHLEQQVVASDTGVIHQNGGGAELLGNPGHGGLHRLFVGDVGTDGQCLPPGCRDLPDDRLACRLVEVQNSDD